MSSNSRISKSNYKESFIVSLKITLIFALVFTLMNQDFSIKAISYCILISAMYSFGLGFAQGILNRNYIYSFIYNTNCSVYKLCEFYCYFW